MQSANDMRAILPILEQYDLKLAIEYREYQASKDLLDLLSMINSDRVGFLFDFGNSMMAYEDLSIAFKNIAKYAFSTHCKDHIVFMHNNTPYVCGVLLGEENIDILSCLKILKNAGLSHINVEHNAILIVLYI